MSRTGNWKRFPAPTSSSTGIHTSRCSSAVLAGVYANAGTWMDDTTFLTIREDAVRLHRWSPEDPERELAMVPRIAATSDYQRTLRPRPIPRGRCLMPTRAGRSHSSDATNASAPEMR